MRTCELLLVIVAALAPTHHALGQACVGCTPLTDLGPGLYLGVHQGGLYPGGSNAPPPAHAIAALNAAQRVTPRNGAGAPDYFDGLVGFVAIGMSNTVQGFAPFERQEDLNAKRDGRVVILDTAQGGQGADSMRNPASPYWSALQDKLADAGLTNQQVQVAWIKQAQAQPILDFPQHAINLRDDVVEILHILKQTFPNLEIVYVSSRTYGGYAPNPQRSEPLSYQTGFAFKWLIEDQINGDPALNHDPANGPVTAPVVVWGPYLWANGAVPRSDGLVWLPSDYEGDGVHPAASGEQKVADMLSAFFANNPSAQEWYGTRPGVSLVTVDAAADAHVRSDAPTTNFGASNALEVFQSAHTAHTHARFDASGVDGEVVYAKFALRNLNAANGRPRLHVVADTSWAEATITWNAAPALGALVRTLASSSREGTTFADVTDALANAPGGALGLALVPPPASTSRAYASKEAGDPPRLVLTVLGPCPGDATSDRRVTFDDLSVVLANYGQSGAGVPGDVNGDGVVDFADLSETLANYGNGC